MFFHWITFKSYTNFGMSKCDWVLLRWPSVAMSFGPQGPRLFYGEFLHSTQLLCSFRPCCLTQFSLTFWIVFLKVSLLPTIIPKQPIFKISSEHTEGNKQASKISSNHAGNISEHPLKESPGNPEFSLGNGRCHCMVLEAKTSAWGKSECCSKSNLPVQKCGKLDPWEIDENIYVPQLVEHGLALDLLVHVVSVCVALSECYT